MLQQNVSKEDMIAKLEGVSGEIFPVTQAEKETTRQVPVTCHYPFGTQIMIKGTMYTVEDRGGKGIENDIHRVDIFVPDHQQALRMGRYKTTAKIYRLGR